MPRYDLLIRNGSVVDGTGSPAFHADVAVTDGRIAEVAPKLSAAEAREVLDADGHIVTPGFIDPHTHFDGQATWEDQLNPSFGHGNTTVVMGNCGVGFAPVRRGEEQALIDIMEGVEDIPFDTLAAAIPWGKWESYPEYLAHLRSRNFSMDLGSQIPHGALRAYVMGADRVFEKDASPDQIDAMAKMVSDGIKAGALGLSTSRVVGHKAMASGQPVPGTFASEQELTVLARAMGVHGRGVLQMIPSSATGTSGGIYFDPKTTQEEVAMMANLSRASGRPVTFTTFQNPDAPDEWRFILDESEKAKRHGASLHPQVAARAPGILTSLESYHPFMRRETYLKIRHLPLAERVREMRKPEIKAAILSDRDILHERAGSTENYVSQYLKDILGRMAPLGAKVNYEPDENQFVAGIARARGDSEQSVFYDLLLEQEGTNVLMLALQNYLDGNLNAVREMFLHPTTVSGLGDAGAHNKLICDASTPTFVLSYFVRDRKRGPKMPLEAVIAKLSSQTADVYGLNDRGRLLAGKRADINVIDAANIRLGLPRIYHDMPLGAGRLLQKSEGYRATFVKGVATRLNDEDTGKRPGKLISNL